MLRNSLLNVYAFVMGHPSLIILNRFVFHASLKSMGVLNFESDFLNGEKKFLKSLLAKKSNPIILDVGANIGKYAQFVLESNPKSKIYCFEPYPTTFKKVKENLQDCKSVVCINKGNELSVLKGLGRALRNIKVHAIHFEFNEPY